MKKNMSLGSRILRAMTALVIGMLLVAGIIFTFTTNKASKQMALSNKQLNETIENISSAYMADLSQNQILELASGKAEIADKIFSEFKQGVSIAAAAAEQIYSNPELYSPRTVALPDPENDGTLSAQVLYSASIDPEDPEIKEELALIGNVQDVLMAVNASQDNMASLYVASESGFMVQADYISAKKYDLFGNLMPLEAKYRPWYIGASTTGKPFFTAVTKDAHTPRLAIMCGVPVYAHGKLKGVAGAGMYLDDMEELVQSVDMGGSSKACILNKSGKVLFSTYETGTLAAVANAKDIRMSEDTAIATLAQKAVSGETGTTLVNLDGTPSYAAYAPMKTVGWSLIVFLAQEEVEEPIDKLLASLDSMTDASLHRTLNYIRNARFLLLMLLGLSVVVALAVSAKLSNRIVKPIQLLTSKVKTMQGDELDFTWDLNTGDETQTLTEAFQSLTGRMKQYIHEKEVITAEKERISTEMSVASKIQTSMLPSTFPPFPDCTEFDIYALMDPAREVGGDFYDFFLVDDDHLCLVIADVSGKGVPAALFMMASKIILQNCSQLMMSPAEILTRTNETICQNNSEEMFLTVWVGILELSTGRLKAANAGHEYPFIKKPDGMFEMLRDKHGFIIGGMEGLTYKEYELTLEPGSKIFVYTDGVPEALSKNGGEDMFGLNRIGSALNENPDATPKQLILNVREKLETFAKDAEQFDDITMLCVEYNGQKPAAEPSET